MSFNITFDEYQEHASRTAIYPGIGTYAVRDPEVGSGMEPLAYLGLKLAGEAGEVAEKIGKAIRDGVTDEAAWASLMKKELGDVTWYASQIAKELGFRFSEVADENLRKLFDRQQRGVLGGSGDNR